ncbi:hypothetical protein AQ505_13180 [Pedobacter sp. PACM 27299]|uniref:iron chaperone n=1 Tax=Pedobacter sp. PACM 27299 TaxID=1727164 RepID=UPI0007064B82|nr:DUF1801 domain-containing protein [Pedobacter sp. PACM 27299]ALL06367.1 hypothetical protein AQ505_13180 [Pedobacter sp. PACM 27299]
MKNTSSTPNPENISDYISNFPAQIQVMLENFRKTIRETALEAEETINYGIPTFTLNGNLIHFAAYKKHIGFYPAPSGIQAFQLELSGYQMAKGSVQFPIDQPLPLELISRIVAFRRQENLSKEKKRKPVKR